MGMGHYRTAAARFHARRISPPKSLGKAAAQSVESEIAGVFRKNARRITAYLSLPAMEPRE
jgi:hypothetical protein